MPAKRRATAVTVPTKLDPIKRQVVTRDHAERLKKQIAETPVDHTEVRDGKVFSVKMLPPGAAS